MLELLLRGGRGGGLRTRGRGSILARLQPMVSGEVSDDCGFAIGGGEPFRRLRTLLRTRRRERRRRDCSDTTLHHRRCKWEMGFVGWEEGRRASGLHIITTTNHSSRARRRTFVSSSSAQEATNERRGVDTEGRVLHPTSLGGEMIGRRDDTSGERASPKAGKDTLSSPLSRRRETRGGGRGWTTAPAGSGGAPAMADRRHEGWQRASSRGAAKTAVASTLRERRVFRERGGERGRAELLAARERDVGVVEKNGRPTR